MPDLLGRLAAFGLAAAICAVAPDIAGAQQEDGRLQQARVLVDVPGLETPPRVRARYTLQLPPGARRVPLRALGFSESRLDELAARVDGVTAAVEQVGDGTRLLTADVVLPADIPGGSVVLELSYSVGNARRGADPRFDIVVPVVLPTWRAASARDDLFSAEVRLPDRYYIDEVFPTVPLFVTESAGHRTHALTIPAAPGLLRLRGGAGRPPVLRFAMKLDLALLVVLGILSIAGWRGLRRSLRA